MTESSLRALVVDDESPIRQLTARALRGEGFSCDLANDGVEAQAKLDSERYDLVVTDLCMPNRHGHALASELVQSPTRPLVVVLTALSDPRMTKDLLARGVDDVILKPIDYLAFAAKLRALVNRRRAAPQCEATARATNGVARKTEILSKAPVVKPLGLREFETHLANVAQMFPLSQHTLEVSRLAQSKQCGSQELAAAVECEASLAVEVLRLANSCYYKPGGSRVVDLVEAIPRVGHRRVGELALSMHALQLLNAGNLPWMNRDLAWRRTIAAGLAADLLIAQGEHAAIQTGLSLSASLHGLGRVMLGLLFPQHYDAFVNACRERGQTLHEHESRVFPMNHTASMARLLQTWSVPPDIYQPLRYLLEDFNATARYAEPMRSKIELVKLAVLLGWIAVGPWEPWDTVEFVSHQVLKRLRIADPASVLDQIRNGMGSLTGQTATSAAQNSCSLQQDTPMPRQEIRYQNLSTESHDLVAALFQGMGLSIGAASSTSTPSDNAVLVNCLDASPAQIADYCAQKNSERLILLCCGRQLDRISSNGRVVRIPTSYAALRMVCEPATVVIVYRV